MASIAELRDPGPGLRFEMGEMPAFDVLNDFLRELERHKQVARASATRRGLAFLGERAVPAVARSARRGAAFLFDSSAPRRRLMGEIAACVVAGVALLSSGQDRPGGPTPIRATRTVAVASDAPIAGGHPVVLEVARSARWTPIQARQTARRLSTKRAARPVTAMAMHSDPTPVASSRGRLERMHLGWLRIRVVIHDDL